MTTNSDTLRLKYQDKDFKAHMTEANKRRVDSYMKKRLQALAQRQDTRREEPQP